MSTWTNVTDTVLEPGQPIRSVDIIALKNNIIAVPNGAANAPRVQTAAIQDSAVTPAKLAAGERMTTANVLAQTAGASVGAVGTYAFLVRTALTAGENQGGTIAGSNLRYGNTLAGFRAVSPAGTWRRMGVSGYNRNGSGTSTEGFHGTLYLRIS
jgi:hypothetical protein